MAETDSSEAAGHFPVVGIGASAGGVEALETFFRAMPDDNGMAFVVITHLDPHRTSWLAEIIARSTTMPVAPARDGDEVEPQHVYVLPPAGILTIEHGHLRLRERGAEHSDRAPIDIFFSSLAEDMQDRAIGIVLSGGGHDGTLGIKAIKEHGGLTLAQGSDGTEPRFKDMPKSAVATGAVDLEVPVDQMPAEILRVIRAASRDRRGSASPWRCEAFRPCYARGSGTILASTRTRRSSAACSGACRCSNSLRSTAMSSGCSRIRTRLGRCFATC